MRAQRSGLHDHPGMRLEGPGVLSIQIEVAYYWQNLALFMKWSH